MIQAVANWIMFRRARRLANRVLPFLPATGLIADVGSGTGHNAVVLNERSSSEILQFDVTDMHWVGERPVMISEEPESPFFTGRKVECVLLIYVLQYPKDPAELLDQIVNEGAQRILVLQSTYRNRWGKCVVRIQEAMFGPLAFHLARLVRLIPSEDCPVNPVRYFCSDDVIELLKGCGLKVSHEQAHSNGLLGTGSDLFVCRKEVR